MTNYNDIEVGFSGERKPLDPGKYGTSSEPELEIVNFNGSRETNTPGLWNHSFLVTSTNGVPGTAFLNVFARKEWLTPEGVDLAFDKQKGNQGVVQAMRSKLLEDSLQKAKDANTPDEALNENTTKIFKNTIKQMVINLQNIFKLQDWLGVERDPAADFDSLVGTEFAGTVVANDRTGQSEVKTVYARSKKQ